MSRASLFAICALLWTPTVATAQSLESRVAGVRDGSATFYFAARAGVCGDGATYLRIGRSFHGMVRTGMRNMPCDVGPVQVRLGMRDGVVERLDSWVGPLRERGGTSLGAVPAAEGARFLLQLAARGTSSVSGKAILPAVVADSAVTWPALLDIARDTETRSRNTRQEATVWLARFAGNAMAGRKNDPDPDDYDAPGDDEDDLKGQAVFVLSQLPRGEGVPMLLEVARTNKNVSVRRKALFWLSQSGDARALALIEDILKA